MIDQIYIAIHNQLFNSLNKAEVNQFGLPELLYVDLFNQQYQRLIQEEGHDVLPIMFPAILVEFGPIDWSLAQEGTQTITFRVAYETYAETYQTKQFGGAHDIDHDNDHFRSISGSSNQIKALNSFIFLDLVHDALQNFQTTFIRPLKRNQTRFDVDYDNFRVDEIDYQFSFYQVPIKQKYTQVELLELCARPSLPTPPAHDPSLLYVRGQKVSSEGKVFLCIQTEIETSTFPQTTNWAEITRPSMFYIP